MFTATNYRYEFLKTSGFEVIAVVAHLILQQNTPSPTEGCIFCFLFDVVCCRYPCMAMRRTPIHDLQNCRILLTIC